MVDNGFSLNRSEIYGNAVKMACSVRENGRLVDVKRPYPSQLGEGNHGDRVVDIIRQIVPDSEIFIAQRNPNNVLDAALFEIGQKASRWAKDRAMIVNLSFGSNLGAHNGADELEEKLHDIMFSHDSSAPRFVVKSAGNEGGAGIHFSHESVMIGRDGFPVNVRIQESSRTSKETIFLWHKDERIVRYEIHAPDGTIFCDKAYPTERECAEDFGSARGEERVLLDFRRDDGDVRLKIELNCTRGHIQPGVWKIVLKSAYPTSSRKARLPAIRSWIGRSKKRAARFVKAIEKYTITIPGTSPHVFTVSGCDASRELLPRASRGPAFMRLANQPDRGRKPDLTLPGFSSLDDDIRRGTSFAAPRLVGCLGLMCNILSPYPSFDQTRALIRASCVPGQWSPDLGYGILDYDLFAKEVRALARP